MGKKQRDMSQDAKIRAGERFAYGFGGAFGAGAVNIFVAAFLLIFYTEILEVDPLLASSVIGVSKFLDGLSDLVAGKIIDNTHHKMGKARVWILRMIPFTVISIFAIYLMPTGMPTAATAVWMFVTYNMASTVCYTINYVAYMTLNGLMTTDQKSRGSNAGVQMIGNVIISLIGSATIISALKAFSSPVAKSQYGDRKGWICVMSIYMVIYVISELILVFGTRERVKENVEVKTEDSNKKSQNVPFLVTMKALVTNKYWLINILVCFVIYFLMGLESTVASLVCTYIIGDVEFYQVSATINAVLMLLSMLLAFPIMKKLGKRNSVFLGLCIRVLGGVILAINLSKQTIILGGICASLGYGIAGVPFSSMIQDTLTYGEWKSGFSMIGMGNASNSFCNKVGNSIGTILMGAIMSATGYVAAAKTQTASALAGFKAIYIWIPIVVEIIAIVSLLLYDLDKKYDAIAADLKEGRYAPGVKSYFDTTEESVEEQVADDVAPVTEENIQEDVEK